MNQTVRRVYIGEIEAQSRYALAAMTAFQKALKNGDDSDEVFRQLHSYLTHTGCLSKLFWPPVAKQKEGETEQHYEKRLGPSLDKLIRGRELRDMFGILEENVLRNRMLRDHFEHFDERLDKWRLESDGQGGTVVNMIGPAWVVSSRYILRLYDTETRKFSFMGDEYDIQILHEAILIVHAMAQELR